MLQCYINGDQTISMFVILITQHYIITLYFVWGTILYIICTIYIIIYNVGRYILKYANVINDGVYCNYIICAYF